MDKQKEFFEQINEKQFTVKALEASRRLISHWQEEKLIDPYQGEGWRKFSIVEVLWGDIITTLRGFGMSNAHIREVREQLFTKEKYAREALMDKIIYDVLITQQSLYLVINMERKLSVMDNATYIQSLQDSGDHHIVIHFHKVVTDNFENLFATPKFNAFFVLSEEEKKLMEMIRNKQYVSLTIKKKNGELDRVEGKERVEAEKRIFELLQEGKYQNIELKQQDGKVVSIERTVKRKL